METKTISKELTEAICAAIRPQEVYWDYRSKGEAGAEECLKAIESEESRNDFYNDLYDQCIDTLWELESESVLEAVKEFEDDICEELGIDEDDWDADEFVSEHFDDFRDHTSVDLCEHELLGTVNVRLQLYSNFDCINSHWFESQGGFEYKDSYFGDVVDALNLNPAKVKKFWTEKGLTCWGRWPNLKGRDGKEDISYEHFYDEEVNRCAPACLLVVVAQLDAQHMYRNGITLDNIESVTVPKGNTVGFYSGWEGGGSLIETELIRPMTISLKSGRSKYDYWGLVIDGNSGYSMKDCYGAYDSFFKSELIINTQSK